MTDPAAWERVDQPADTPSSLRAGRTGAGGGAGAGSGAGEGAAGGEALGGRRLRRNRAPVIASFDAGGDVFQRRLRTLVVASTVLLVPLVAINLWVTVVGFERFDPDDALFPSLGSGTSSGVEDVAPFVGAVAISLATAIVGYLVAVVVLADRLGRQVPGVGSSLRATLRALPRVVAVWVVGHWWQPLLALILLSVDREAVAGLATLFGMLAWFSTAATLFAVPVMVAEQLGPVAALRRAWQLFRRAAGTAFGFVGLSTLLGSLFLLGLATLAPLLEAYGFASFGGAAWAVQGVIVQLGVLLVVPLIAACSAQCYVEVRLDREGLDLVLDADRAFGTDPIGERAAADTIVGGAPA